MQPGRERGSDLHNKELTVTPCLSSAFLKGKKKKVVPKRRHFTSQQEKTVAVEAPLSCAESYLQATV